MEWLLDSPLMAASSRLDEPAACAAGPPWTWREVHDASITLARRLGDACAVCNLCTSRIAFLVAWLAALRSGRLMVLPPSGGQGDLAAVLKAGRRPVVVVDDPQALQAPWRQGADCLDWRPERRPTLSTAAELAWQPAWDATAALLYTSGSTGVPEAQPKSLRQLAHGARILGERLSKDVEGGLGAIRRIVCSVPPQHMFGLEGSVMLSLVHGMPVLDRRPLLPADVRDAFAQGAPAAWVATPLHLRSLVQAGERLPNCSVVIASTMPLAQAVARDTEALVGAPVLEIYGSTETGVLALRRTAREVPWRPLGGVHLESSNGATLASGSHFASPLTLPDEVDCDADGRFRLLGRHADMVKIAGRRASLAGLNLLLQDLPGLDDGVFYLPSGANGTERLCLVYSGPRPLDREAAQRWLRARLDPVFLPRVLIHVDRLPRGDSGKLPRHALDAVYEQWRAGAQPPARESDRGRTRNARFVVPADHPALAGHFPGRPIVPGVLLLDSVLVRLAAAFDRPVARLKQVKFASPLLPGEPAQVEFQGTGSHVAFSVSTRRDGAAVLLASGSIVLDAPAMGEAAS